MWYLFRLVGKPPLPHEEGPRDDQPIRTAGITPAPSAQRPPARHPEEVS